MADDKNLSDKNVENIPDTQSNLTTTVKTEDGLEEAHFDMNTGQVTYGPAKCSPKGQNISEGTREAAKKLNIVAQDK